MKRHIILFISLFVLSVSAQAQKGKFKFSISVKGDSLDQEEKREESKSFFGKVISTIRTVKEVIGDPTKLSVSLEDTKGNKETLKDYLKRKGPLKSKESYLPDAYWREEELVAS
jgi:hypothetical protein